VLISIGLSKLFINCLSFMEEQIAILKKTIEERLLPLVDRDYVFLDFPNIGDSLIAAAAFKLLKKVPYHCLYSLLFIHLIKEKYHQIP